MSDSCCPKCGSYNFFYYDHLGARCDDCEYVKTKWQDEIIYKLEKKNKILMDALNELNKFNENSDFNPSQFDLRNALDDSYIYVSDKINKALEQIKEIDDEKI